MWNFFAEKQLFSLFFAVLAANLQQCQKSINGVTPTSDTPSLGLKQHEIKYVARTYLVSVALRMSDVSGGRVNIDIGTMNGFSCKVEFSCNIAARL